LQQTYRITYDLDLSGYDGPAEATYVSAVAAKVVAGPDLISWNTVAGFGAPTGGTWVDATAGLNNGGCSGSGGGFVCTQWQSGEKMLVGGVYSWVFDITVKTGTLLDVGSIKANFDPPQGLLLSENVAVPESIAAEIPLLLAGLGLFVMWRRKTAVESASVSR
jgi:hypothetical protein